MTRHRMFETGATRSGHRSFIALAVVLGGSGVPGCASGRTDIKSQTNLAGTTPIKRLVVYEDGRATGLTSDMRTALQAALAKGFTACGVASTMVASALDLDTSKRVGASAKDFEMAAVLQIEPAAGRVPSKDESQLRFALKLVDLASQQVTWRANAEFDVELGGHFTDEVKSGERLGTSIVSRLRDDGVLPGCPSLVAGWPRTPHAEPPPVKPTHLR
jgi:hypothetical protein